MTGSLIKIIENSFRQSWDRPAFTDYGSDLTYKYSDVAIRISFIHCLFEELSIKPGDKVAICDKNSSNWAVAMLATITYRAVAVPLLPDYSEKQLVELCEHCDAKFMIGSRRLAKLWPEGNCPMYLIDISDLLAMNPSAATDDVEERAYRRYSEKYPDGFTVGNLCYEAENPDDMMLLSYTSGSTGNPKGVMLSYASILSNNRFCIGLYDFWHANFFVVMPMAHMFGFTCDFLSALAYQAHMYFLTTVPAPSVLLKAFREIRPRVFLCVPMVIEKIVKSKVMPVIETPRMRCMLKIPVLRQIVCTKIRTQFLDAFGGNLDVIIMGGAALHNDVDAVLNMIKFPYCIGYGMTECGPLITFSSSGRTRHGSCGQAVLNMEVKVLSPDPQNQPGEIVARGANVMMGYYKNPTATEESIDAGGWLHTGDLGVIDSDGYLFIRGRKKNMLLSSNGQNVYPEEAEDQVVTHSLFEECVVTQRNGKLIALVYVSDSTLKKMGMRREDIDLESVRKEINTHLPKYCQLSQLEQRDEEFEKTPKKSIKRFLYT